MSAIQQLEDGRACVIIDHFTLNVIEALNEHNQHEPVDVGAIASSRSPAEVEIAARQVSEWERTRDAYRLIVGCRLTSLVER